MDELHADPARAHLNRVTGFYVRARDAETDKWITADMAQLDKASLEAWLDGYDKPAIISVITSLMGHPYADDQGDSHE